MLVNLAMPMPVLCYAMLCYAVYVACHAIAWLAQLGQNGADWWSELRL